MDLYKLYDAPYNERSWSNAIYTILKTREFDDWFLKQNQKTQLIIDARLQRIEKNDHFGTVNKFDGLIELKWGSGLRIYTFRYEKTTIVVLLGGNKNAQEKDIKKAKSLKAEIEKNGFKKT